MQILALGGVFDWPVPATGCDMANELLCPLRTNYGSLHSASILSLPPLPSLRSSSSMGLGHPAQFPLPQEPSSPGTREEAPAGLGNPRQAVISSKWPFLVSETPGSSRARLGTRPSARLQHGKRTIIIMIITTTISFCHLERNRNPFKV